MRPLDETIQALSEKLLALEPGPLAELRRMDPGRVGPPAFWRIAVTLDFPENSLDAWMHIVKILAILTPKGNRGVGIRLNQSANGLGAALCDGGDANWPLPGKSPTPKLSEQRLARFLAMPGLQRGDALERIVRMLANSRSPSRGIRCTEVARLLLSPDDEQPLKTVARDYYARLDRATTDSNKEGTR